MHHIHLDKHFWDCLKCSSGTKSDGLLTKRSGHSPLIKISSAMGTQINTRLVARDHGAGLSGDIEKWYLLYSDAIASNLNKHNNITFIASH